MARMTQLKQFYDDLNQHEGRDAEDTALRTRRREAMARNPRVELYLAKLAELFRAVRAIPGAYTDDAEIAALLNEQEAEHDGHGAALYFLVVAHLRLPHLSEERREALQHLQAALVPNLGLLRRSQAEEVARAHLNEAAQPELTPLLLTLPVEAGRTALDWARAHIDAGLEIGRLLAQRDLARSAGTTDRTEIVRLRAEIVRVFNRFREALRDEEELGGTAHAGDTQLVFGPLDQILAR